MGSIDKHPEQAQCVMRTELNMAMWRADRGHRGAIKDYVMLKKDEIEVACQTKDINGVTVGGGDWWVDYGDIR